MAGWLAVRTNTESPLRYGSTVVVMAVDTAISRGYEEPYIQYMGDHGHVLNCTKHRKYRKAATSIIRLNFKLRLAAIGYSTHTGGIPFF